jgi:DNA-binding MarR family transcriptional regulator
MASHKSLKPDEAASLAARCACFNFRKASRVITGLFDRTLKPSGLSSNQLVILLMVRTLEPVPMTELASALFMDKTTFTRNIRPLLAKKALKYQTGKDRRVRLLIVTPQGYEMIFKAFPLWQQAQQKVEQIYSERAWPQVLKHLESAARLS